MVEFNDPCATTTQLDSWGFVWQTSHNEGYHHIKVINTLLDPGAEKNLQAPLDLGHHVKQGLVQGVARIGVEGILSRDEFSAILERSLREGLANTTGGFVSSHIGVLAKTDEIDGVSQKIAHAALGAAEAAIRGGNPAAGAIGAVVGEIVGEIYRDQKEQAGEFDPDREDFQEIVDKGVDIARFTAANAARYNALFVLPAIIQASLYVAGVALTIHEACEIYELYQTKGAKEALNRLAVDGAITIVTGGIGKGVHKAYQVGAKYYPSAALAWEAVQAQSPVFYAIGQKIIGAKEWVKLTFDQATEKLILKTTQKLAQKPGKVPQLAHDAQGLKKGNIAHEAQPLHRPDLASNQNPYNPQGMRNLLEERYPGQIDYASVPADNLKNVKLAGQRHPQTEVVPNDWTGWHEK